MRTLRIGEKKIDLDKNTIIMGILNVTPDSFSDGGKYFSVEKAVKHAITMEKQGADIIDIGGESTRPNAISISAEEETRRILPIIKQLIKKIKIPISIDTYKSQVAEKALDLGVKMVNDITALRGDKNLIDVIANYDVPVCLMHMKGKPRNMQEKPYYDDVIKEIKDFLREKTLFAIDQGIKKEKIIIDPGLGFGKRTGQGIEDNCKILRYLKEFKTLGYPVLIGASRKTFIGKVCGNNKTLPPDDRLGGSLAAACYAVINGADIIRAHDVKETYQCIKILDCIIKKSAEDI